MIIRLTGSSNLMLFLSVFFGWFSVFNVHPVWEDGPWLVRFHVSWNNVSPWKCHCWWKLASHVKCARCCWDRVEISSGRSTACWYYPPFFSILRFPHLAIAAFKQAYWDWQRDWIKRNAPGNRLFQTRYNSGVCHLGFGWRIRLETAVWLSFMSVGYLYHGQNISELEFIC